MLNSEVHKHSREVVEQLNNVLVHIFVVERDTVPSTTGTFREVLC